MFLSMEEHKYERNLFCINSGCHEFIAFGETHTLENYESNQSQKKKKSNKINKQLTFNSHPRCILPA